MVEQEESTQQQQDSLKLKTRVKKSLLWFGIFSIIMIFAGLTSAYIVSNGSEFWVKITLPDAFLYSTLMIVAGSLALILSKSFVKKQNAKLTKLSVGAALIFAGLFGYFQFAGWAELFSRGNTLRDHVLNQSGRYGQYYSLSYEGSEITFDGYDFFWKGDVISENLHEQMKEFSRALMEGAVYTNKEHAYNLTGYGTQFTLYSGGNPVSYANQQLTLNGQMLPVEAHERVYRFAECIVNNRGDFMMTGRYGEDFEIYYKGKKVEYTNRSFFMNGQRLSAKQDNDLRGSRNKSSSYIWVFTLVHMLHWVGGLIALMVIFSQSLRNKYTAENHLGIQLGSIYWHFLGLLWIYLYLFLIFYH